MPPFEPPSRKQSRPLRRRPAVAPSARGRHDGQAVVLVAVDGKPAGLVGVDDTIEEGVPEAIRTLMDSDFYRYIKQASPGESRGR